MFDENEKFTRKKIKEVIDGEKSSFVRRNRSFTRVRTPHQPPFLQATCDVVCSFLQRTSTQWRVPFFGGTELLVLMVDCNCSLELFL